MNPNFGAVLFASICFGLPFGLSAQSQAEDERVEEIVITASRLPSSLNKLSASISRISAQDIERQNVANPADLLRNIEGVHISQPGGPGGVASLHLRGAEANFATVLVDGVKLNNPNNSRGGSFDFATLAVADIERIEVIRGPQSAIYGSDALSGVVNFISRDSEESGGSLSLEQGQDSSALYSARATLALDEHNFLNLGGSSVDAGELVPGDTFKSDTAWATLSGGSATQETRYKLSLRRARADKTAFPEDSGGSRLAVLRQSDSGDYGDHSASLLLNHTWNERWQSQFILSTYEREDGFVSPGVAPGPRGAVPPNRFDSLLQRDYVQLSSRYESANLAISFGVDRQEEEASSTGAVEFAPGVSFPADYSIERSIEGLFVDVEIPLTEQVLLLSSLRYDDPKGNDSEVSPAVGLVATLNAGATVVRANWAEGFKLPSFFALASPLVGNPLLLEEQVNSRDLSLEQALSPQLSLQLTLFDADYEDLIDFDSAAFINVNRSSVGIQGAEAALSYSLSPHSDIRIHATYTDIDVAGGGQLRQRPDWRAGALFDSELRPNLNLHARLLYVGETFDSSIPTGDVRLPSYVRADTSLSWQLNSRLRLALALDNLLDENYEEAIGFGAAERRLRISANITF